MQGSTQGKHQTPPTQENLSTFRSDAGALLQIAAKASISADTVVQVSKIQYLAWSQQGVQFINWAKESSVDPGSSLFFSETFLSGLQKIQGIFFQTSSEYFKNSTKGWECLYLPKRRAFKKIYLFLEARK